MTRFDRIAVAVIFGLLVAILAIAARGDRAGAGIAGHEPGDNSRPATTTSIRIAFVGAMDAPSVEARFSIQPSIEGETRWEGNTFVFRPSVLLDAHQSYRVTLEAGATSRLGRATKQAITWAFQPRLPSIVYLSPSDSQLRELWIASLDGNRPRKLFDSPRGLDSFSPSPDGEQIALTVNGEDEAADLWLINRDGSEPRQLTTCAPAFCGRPAWSPNGNVIAYERRENGDLGEGATGRIWLYDVSSNSSAPLFQDVQQIGFDVVWSADGDRLAFFDPDRAAIRIVSLASGDATNLSSQMGQTGTFAPDGLSMAFVDIRPVGAQLFAELWLGEFSENPQTWSLLDNAEEDQFPAWSPDGKWIAFGRRDLDRQGGMGSQLCLLDVANGIVTQITSDRDFNHTRFRWSLDSKYLLVERFRLGDTSARPEIWTWNVTTQALNLVAPNGLDAQWTP